MKHVDYKMLLSACLGITLGWPATLLYRNYFDTSVDLLPFWGLAGILFIFFATRDTRKSLLLGAFYGFFLVLSFSLITLEPAYNPILGFLFILAIALVGAVGGAICGVLALALHALTKIRPSSN